jgi:hypothetical protein
MAAPLDYVRPELFDEAVDRQHRSYVSAVLGRPLGVIRCRTTRTLLPIHPQWIPKYVIHIYYFFLFFTIVIVLSKLLFFQATRCRTTPCWRLVEGDRLRAEVPRAERLTRFNFDAPVATRDVHVPPPHRRDDSQSGGHRDVGRTAVCWRGDGAD